MKIYDGKIAPSEYLKEEEKEISELINKTKPSFDSKLSFLRIKDNAGWAYLSAKINETEFSINYSSLMFDTPCLIKFFADTINSKEEITLFLDNEGSEPLLYAKPVDQDNLRFIFASDYELYAKFCENKIEDYNTSDYKIECDIIINKKTLLKEFYNIFSPFIMKYDVKKAYEPFDVDKANKYLEEIKNYINS